MRFRPPFVAIVATFCAMTAVWAEDAPTGNSPAPLSPYRIEPPDVLHIEVRRTAKDDYVVEKGEPDSPVILDGKFLVAPNGTVNLGRYGEVKVAELTPSRAQNAVREHLVNADKQLQRDHGLEVSLDVFACNSKFYYIVQEGAKPGDQIIRIPITGVETVADAMTHIGGVPKESRKKIWVARPASVHGAKKARVLGVDWRAIVNDADTSTNWQLFPGDRLFITN
ncbi:MAG TPA: polysaccharide biosynthesis/export family protein [Pirellulales bacterium]|nr:polysaccharide biosynthesis/export family protein [Pirellulales bacterium]